MAKSGYEVLISSVYSREFLFVDSVVKNTTAKEKIGSIGDVSNIRKWQKNISDGFYTKLVNADDRLMFEFDRNKEFFENLLEQKIDIKKPIINLPKIELSFDLPKEKYAILFIGASAEYRKWSVEKFAKVGRWLSEKQGYKIVLCGANSDLADAMRFTEFYGDDFVNLVGKTSLVELLAVIYNGNHFGRFTPYPHGMSTCYKAIYHPVIAQNLQDYEKLSNSYGYGSTLDINEISVEQVLGELELSIKS